MLGNQEKEEEKLKVLIARKMPRGIWRQKLEQKGKNQQLAKTSELVRRPWVKHFPRIPDE